MSTELTRAYKALANYVMTHGSCGLDAKALAGKLGGRYVESSTRSHALALCLQECRYSLGELCGLQQPTLEAKVEP
jgi:hypothetical protein